jgi:acyl-CoA synthetase (AMP-forming)/AMP-acid ligase II
MGNPLYSADELRQQMVQNGAKKLVAIGADPFGKVAAEAVQGTSVDETFSINVGGEIPGATPFLQLLAGDGNYTPVEVSPDDVCMMPTSSGTTGPFKSVMLTHRNVATNILQVDAMLSYAPDDVLVGVVPFFHIYGAVLLMMTPIWKGTKVVVFPRFDMEGFLTAVEKYQTTILHVVPPIMVGLSKHPMVDKFDNKSVKYFFCGAAPMSSVVEKAVCARFTNATVRQGYGMTEMSPVSHIMPLECPEKYLNTGTIGLLAPNMECKIVNTETGELCGPDVEGEVQLRGPNVMKGYLKAEEATAATVDQEGFIHTGDLGTVNADGWYWITGRSKELIKYNGYQVAPAELEALLLANDKVADCAVVGVPDETAGELPRAYIVLKPGQEATEEDIQKYIEPLVNPQKKLRGGVRFIEAIPKSASGKILRRVLVDQIKEELKAAAAK